MWGCLVIVQRYFTASAERENSLISYKSSFQPSCSGALSVSPALACTGVLFLLISFLWHLDSSLRVSWSQREITAFCFVILGSNFIAGAWKRSDAKHGRAPKLHFSAVPSMTCHSGAKCSVAMCPVNHLQHTLCFRWSEHSSGLSAGHSEGTGWSFSSWLRTENEQALLLSPPPFYKTSPIAMLSSLLKSTYFTVFDCVVSHFKKK